MRMHASRGFTLIEVLIATVLLAVGLTLAFATIGAATKTTQRGESMAAHSERIRAVEGFLRRRLESTRPVPFHFDAESGAAQRRTGIAGGSPPATPGVETSRRCRAAGFSERRQIDADLAHLGRASEDRRLSIYNA